MDTRRAKLIDVALAIVLIAFAIANVLMFFGVIEPPARYGHTATPYLSDK